ncbi:MAG: hypothetical protein ACM3OO_09690 [Planctomycetaceae bacterium]
MRRTRSDLVGSWARRAIREPVVGILVLAGIADIVSNLEYVHGAALIVVGIAIVLDGRRSGEEAGPSEASGSGGAEPAAAVLPVRGSRVLVAVGFAFLAGLFSRYSWPATLAVAVPATAGVVIGWRTPPGRRDPGPLGPAGVRAWAGVFLTLASFELANLLLQPSLVQGSTAHPTLSVLADPLLASYAGRTLFLLAWLATGWYLLER